MPQALLGIIARQEAVMTSSFLRWLCLLALVVPCAAAAQDAGKACAVVMLHGKAVGPQTLAGLARRVQAACAVRSPELPWGERKPDKDAPSGMQVVAKHVKELRRQGYKRILVLGHGLGANAAMAYGGSQGDTDGVIALGGDLVGNPEGWGELPTLAGKLKQHQALLWLVAASDPLAARGEDFAFAKAPPHPASRFALVKGDGTALPEAGAGAVLEWIRDSQ
jgi:dienelactone hydrolase